MKPPPAGRHHRLHRVDDHAGEEGQLQLGRTAALGPGRLGLLGRGFAAPTQRRFLPAMVPLVADCRPAAGTDRAAHLCLPGLKRPAGTSQPKNQPRLDNERGDEQKADHGGGWIIPPQATGEPRDRVGQRRERL
jgi:hypothetical protein